MRNLCCGVLAICVVVGLAGAAWAEEPARPKKPFVIADFETPEDLAKWTGLDRQLTEDYSSSGTHGMRFDIPKYVKERGDEPRPRVELHYNDGQGFPFKDFSAYGAIAIDVWVEAEEAEGGKESVAEQQPGKFGLKVIDSAGLNSWTTHIEVLPERLNKALLSIDDAATDCDITDVEQIVLYSLRPDHPFTLVVDNLRLLPRARPSMASFQLLYPNYRGLILPDERCVEFAATVEFAEYGIRARDLALRVTVASDVKKRKKHTMKRRVRQRDENVVLPAKFLPEGPATVKAELVWRKTDNILAREQWSVEPVSEEALAALDVYVDRNKNLIVDGEPYFPLGWYSGASEEQLAEIADSPYNCVLIYGTNRMPKDKMTHLLDLLQEKDLKLIYCMNDVYPTAAYYDGKNWEGVEGNEAIADAVVAAYRDHPAMLAWYLNDELPIDLAPDLKRYYDRLCANDPAHPGFIVLCNKKDFRYLQSTTDIVGGDTYPIPHNPVTLVSAMVDRAREASNDTKPVWMVPQAFAWYQHNSDNPDRGHIPTEQELLDGRAPSYEEARCMTYLALTHGAKGLVYWCYYNMRVLPQYEEMWAWMKDIGEEVKTLSPVLLSPDDLGTVAYTPCEASIHTKLKRHDGRAYLMSVNSDKTPCHITFDLGQRLPENITVMFEDRDIATQDTQLSDDFAPLEVHVYDLGEAD